VRRHVGDLHLTERIPLVSGAIARSRTGLTEGLTPEAALHARRNYRYGVMNGVVFGLAEAIIAPGLVLALFVNRLGGPNVLVGLIPAILAGGWFLPQLLVAGRVQGMRRVMPLYRRAGAVRFVALVVLAIATFALADYPALLLAAFFTCFSVYAFSGGITGLPWIEIVGKVISPRRRGSFFSMRSFWGGVLALLASGAISAVLSEKFSGLTFPYNFALLFLIASVIVGVAIWAWASILEPESAVVAEPMGLRAILRRGTEAFRSDRDYRSFMVARILLALASVADPFYAVYANTVLGAPTAIVGLYLGASSGASLISNFFWGPLSDRAGNRSLMTITVLSVGLVPLSALLIPLLQGLVPQEQVHTAFAVVFVLAGLAVGSGRIVNNNMMLTIAPPAERAIYVGFINTVLGLVTLVPPLGGLLVDAVGFVWLFAVSLVLALAGLLASTRMSTKRADS
jgi:MFS family permease